MFGTIFSSYTSKIYGVDCLQYFLSHFLNTRAAGTYTNHYPSADCQRFMRQNCFNRVINDFSCTKFIYEWNFLYPIGTNKINNLLIYIQKHIHYVIKLLCLPKYITYPVINSYFLIILVILTQNICHSLWISEFCSCLSVPASTK